MKLQRVRVRELHADLRKWVTENLDDVRLSRLYFDEKGGLTLTCDAPDPAVKAVVEKELNDRAAKLVPAAEPPATPKDGKDAKGEKEPNAANTRLATYPVAARLAADDTPAPPKPDVKFTKFPGGLTKFLQQQVADPKNTQWDAVLIERGFFNEKNEYTVRGVVNNELQKKQLGEYLDELAKDPMWADYFKPNPRGPLELEVIPMGKLVERVRRVTPAYPIFDGIRVNGAKYVFEKDSRGNSGQTLVFVAHLVGRTDRDAPATLRSLIAEDTKFFGRRLPAGRPIRFEEDPDGVPSNDQVGEFSIGYGATALSKGELKKAKEWLDVALLHYPQESAVWFLDAYYNHLLGDDELTRRDLYRIIDIEGRLAFDGPIQRKRRYLAAKDLQGERRDELEKMWLECWKEVKDGAQPMKFAEGK